MPSDALRCLWITTRLCDTEKSDEADERDEMTHHCSRVVRYESPMSLLSTTSCLWLVTTSAGSDR